MHCNMLVPDSELLDKLNIRKYEDNGGHKNEVYSYIRSWTIPSNIFEEIINSFLEDGTYSTTITKWLLLKSANDKQATFHVKYVGMCKLPSTPIASYNDDIKTRTNGFMVRLFKKKCMKSTHHY